MKAVVKFEIEVEIDDEVAEEKGAELEEYVIEYAARMVGDGEDCKVEVDM